MHTRIKIVLQDASFVYNRHSSETRSKKLKRLIKERDFNFEYEHFQHDLAKFIQLPECLCNFFQYWDVVNTWHTCIHNAYGLTFFLFTCKIMFGCWLLVLVQSIPLLHFTVCDLTICLLIIFSKYINWSMIYL